MLRPRRGSRMNGASLARSRTSWIMEKPGRSKKRPNSHESTQKRKTSATSSWVSTERSSIFWMVRTPNLQGRNLRMVLRIGLGNSVRVVKQPRMRNSRKMLETRSWVFSRVKERNRKKRRPRRIGLPVRSTRWPVEVKPEISTRISWSRVCKCFAGGKDDQSNESAIEQLKDEQVANAIRLSFKSVTGHLPKGK